MKRRHCGSSAAALAILLGAIPVSAQVAPSPESTSPANSATAETLQLTLDDAIRHLEAGLRLDGKNEQARRLLEQARARKKP